MKELNFSTGLISYKVNGECDIFFNPADVSFVGRLFKTFDDLAKQQDRAEAENIEYSGADLFEIAEQRDKDMRAAIDAVFDEPVCDKVFRKQSVYALAEGLPLWCNFLMAIIDEVDAAVAEHQKLANPRVERYMAKYAKYERK